MTAELAERYRDALAADQDATAAQVLAALEATRPDVFPALAALLVAAGIARQVTLADAYLALALSALRGRTVPAVGALPSAYAEPARLEAAFRTSLEVYRGDPRPSVTRIATGEVAGAGRRALADGMRTRRVGWTRSARPTACQPCRALADGTVLSPRTVMADHPGCTCVAVIVDQPQED